MNLALPVYVEERRTGSGSRRYLARALFEDSILEEGDRLHRVLGLLSESLRRYLESLAALPRHDGLARLAFHPPLEETRLKTWVEVGGRRLRVRLLAVAFRWLDRRVAFLPGPEVWFALERGRSLEERAQVVLEARLRREIREDDEDFDPGRYDLGDDGRAWLTSVEVDVRARQIWSRGGSAIFRAALGPDRELDGRTELERVGRSVERLHPDGLARAIGVDGPLGELERRLADPRRRPVLLLGPRGCGKTALVHERVARRLATEPRIPRHGNTWLVAPQRLVSGMSYVGQWEARLLAILAEVRRRAHVLYVDDLLGLFQAGISASADLSVAQVLRPFLERGEVLFLGEATPEEFRRVQEMDRMFADLFEPVVLSEPGEDSTLRVLVAVERRLEERHRCRFALDVLPAVLDLTRRYVRDVAFPGKGARLLEELAARGRDRTIGRQDALDAFQATTGLPLEFLDPRRRLDADGVARALGRRVVGQPAAIEAVSEVVGIAKARLADPRRPLGVLLLAGPTGVGKTQVAKTLAEVLFGNEDRLVRLDMNEFVEPGSAARLVGTFDRPEGLLTGPVRRRPFAVVLLDEIEKATPEVFDLLLQVMGEGRLTDALGRTADFTNAVVLLTTNLGVREAGALAGFRESPGASDAVAVHRREIERFFRPEFVNRIDRIVAFGPLDRTDLEAIARVLLAGVLSREGLVRRKVVLDVDPEALGRVADLGFHPRMGARALKRSIERHLARPISRALVGTSADAPAIVAVRPDGTGFEVVASVLAQVEPVPAEPGDPAGPSRRLEALRAFAARVRGQLASARPAGAIRQGAISDADHFYFRVRTLLERLERGLDELEDRLEEKSRPGAPSVRPPAVRRARSFPPPSLADLAAAEDVRAYLLELARSAPPPPAEVERRLAELAGQAAFLDVAARGRPGSGDRAVLVGVAIPDAGPWREVAAATARVHAGDFDLAVRPVDTPDGGRRIACELEGPGALELARLEEGVHLLSGRDGTLSALAVRVSGLGPGDDPRRIVESAVEPGRPGPVIRIHEASGASADLRTGGAACEFPPAGALRRWILESLPRPAELGGGG